MSSKMIKELRKFFKEVTSENVRLWCESLSAVMRYDSPECGEILGSEGLAEIEKQASDSRQTLAVVQVETPQILVKTLNQHTESLILDKQQNILNALQTAASTDNDIAKVKKLSSLNENDSIVLTIKNTVETGAIPMLFAVFSRKNDGYGLG
jgi:hypothetical protein